MADGALSQWSGIMVPLLCGRGPGNAGVLDHGVTLMVVDLSRSFNEPGRFWPEDDQLAQRKKLDGNMFELRWPQTNVAVVQFALCRIRRLHLRLR